MGNRIIIIFFYFKLAWCHADVWLELTRKVLHFYHSTDEIGWLKVKDLSVSLAIPCTLLFLLSCCRLRELCVDEWVGNILVSELLSLQIPALWAFVQFTSLSRSGVTQFTYLFKCCSYAYHQVTSNNKLLLLEYLRKKKKKKKEAGLETILIDGKCCRNTGILCDSWLCEIFCEKYNDSLEKCSLYKERITLTCLKVCFLCVLAQ